MKTPVWKKLTFYNIILTQNHTWHIPKVIEITVNKSNNYGITPFCHVLCLGMHSNMMHRFMVQAFQDPPFCSSTLPSSSLIDGAQLRCCLIWICFHKVIGLVCVNRHHPWHLCTAFLVYFVGSLYICMTPK
jgi:hypothetical protein